MKNILTMACVLVLDACSTSSSSEESGTGLGQGDNNPPVVSLEWSIPRSEVLDGGPGKDGIPALVNPIMADVQAINYLRDTDLVIGIKNGDDVRAYSHAILDWHEIINDNLDDVSVAITYCPLTGTGIGWDRIIKGVETTFGVSGLLYNTNLIPYDRATDSNWSQILNESVNGELLGDKVELIRLFETDWQTWKSLYPNSKVVTTNTGFSRTYGASPYGDYNTNNDRFLFPVPKDPRLPSKERVHAIIDGSDARAYRFSDFSSNNIIRDTFKGRNYLIIGNTNFIVSFELTSEPDQLEFEYIHTGSEVLLQDNEDNQWNIFGEALSGPREGQFLDTSASFMGFWFSIPAFYTTEIFGS
ncbi:DUF3179 domain-containing protein [Flagellimonas sp. CMM7]|uniref:DUF3179 domain-containing protein n=1 Tax=Flagellimonas sp. CMM7 TaxID=2654676 RepID=UPI0013D4D732|nr:DUF3179 domain-containing protein [Flagellimonas sp. CMM7]UII80295.1 DUF3179 domain-containing protein [Flagellimonas sp. CMM7]